MGWGGGSEEGMSLTPSHHLPRMVAPQSTSPPSSPSVSLFVSFPLALPLSLTHTLSHAQELEALLRRQKKAVVVIQRGYREHLRKCHLRSGVCVVNQSSIRAQSELDQSSIRPQPELNQSHLAIVYSSCTPLHTVTCFLIWTSQPSLPRASEGPTGVYVEV